MWNRTLGSNFNKFQVRTIENLSTAFQATLQVQLLKNLALSCHGYMVGHKKSLNYKWSHHMCILNWTIGPWPTVHGAENFDIQRHNGEQKAASPHAGLDRWYLGWMHVHSNMVADQLHPTTCHPGNSPKVQQGKSDEEIILHLQAPSQSWWDLEAPAMGPGQVIRLKARGQTNGNLKNCVYI